MKFTQGNNYNLLVKNASKKEENEQVIAGYKERNLIYF